MENNKLSQEMYDRIDCQIAYLKRKNELDLKKIKLLQKNIEDREKELHIYRLYVNK